MRLANLLFWFSCTLTGCAARIEAPAVIVVASDLDNLPFAGVSPDGTPVGRDVEMMQLLAERICHVLEWRRMPFDVLLSTVAAGEVDVVCATLGITPERELRVLFSQPYYETAIAIVVRAGPGEPRTLAELRGKRVSAGAGTTSQRAVLRHLPDAVSVFKNKEGWSAEQRLLERDIDAAAMDGPAADALVRTSNGRLRRIELALDAEHYALALPKSRGRLRDRLNRALAELRAGGGLDALNQKHGLSGK